MTRGAFAASAIRLAPGDGTRAAALLALSEDRSFSAQLWGARRPSLPKARRILDQLACPARPGPAGFFVIVGSGNVVAGVCRVDPLGAREHLAEVGYLIARSFRGQGYASFALRLLVEHAYLAAPLQTLRAFCEPDNVASCRVLATVGFRPAPRARSRRLRYELTRPEWSLASPNQASVRRKQVDDR